MAKKATLLGGTGLVGRELLRLLVMDERYDVVNVVTRRASGASNPKVRDFIGDLSVMDQHRDAFRTDDIFCALGTTIAVAGSQEAFRAVDYGHVLRAAQLGREEGASRFLLVSALGADASSRIFYNRVKGEVERDVSALGFPSVVIAQPSLLLGPRMEKRFGEEVAKKFGWLTPSAYKPIPAESVAIALVAAANDGVEGVRVLPSRKMRTEHPAERRV